MHDRHPNPGVSWLYAEVVKQPGRSAGGTADALPAAQGSQLFLGVRHSLVAVSWVGVGRGL